jgi:acyl-CoA synthetase (AMP-forming)/AMP-acid ligase II
MNSVPALLDARRSAPAVSFPGEACSYAELIDASVRAAGRLRALGVERGDRVGILLRVASLEWPSQRSSCSGCRSSTTRASARSTSARCGW